MLLFLIISHNPAWWPTYGFDLANTHFSPLKGAMSSAPSITWEYTGAGYVERPPATAEIGDGDLCLETLVPGYNTGTLALVDGVNQSVQWSQAFTGGYGSPCLKDVAGDGVADVVVDNAGGVVYCMNANTGALNWSVTMMYSKCEAGAAACDLDNNGTVEVVIGCNNSAGCLYSINGATGAVNWTYPVSYGVHRAVSLIDVNGDNAVEILLPGCNANGSNTLKCLSPQDTLLWQVSFSTAHDIHDPSNADIDGDGCAELIVGTYGVDAAWFLDDVAMPMTAGCLREGRRRLSGDPLAEALFRIWARRARLTQGYIRDAEPL